MISKFSEQVDKERAAYYNQHSDSAWGAADTYDLCVDTDKVGIQETAELIVALEKKMNF